MRGVTRFWFVGRINEDVFQPALPMRGVTRSGRILCLGREFQPALPMRGVTLADGIIGGSQAISTRTPHAGSDDGIKQGHRLDNDFNPHSPCGE